MCRTSLKPARRASVRISVGVKKLTNGVPLARAPFCASSRPGRSSGSASSIGSTNVIARMDRGAMRVEAAGGQPLSPRIARLEIHGHESQRIGYPETDLDQPLPLPRLRARPIDFKHPEPRRHFRPALYERIQARSENDVLADTALRLLEHQVLDETRAGEDGSAERLGEDWVHVGPPAPVLIRCDQPQPDVIFENVGRGIDLHVQCTPQGDAHRRVIRRRCRVVHGALLSWAARGLAQSWAEAPTATHARSALETDSSLNVRAAAVIRVNA